MQKITVIGTGYVGLIAGLGFAKWGNEVVCLDVVPEKIEKLQKGICPIYEPGAEVQLTDGLASGRLRCWPDTFWAFAQSSPRGPTRRPIPRIGPW